MLNFRPALLLVAVVLPAADLTVDSLAWMAGCWEMRHASSVTEEQWMKPAGGMMLGMSRTVVAGRVRFHETLRIETREGRLVYVARPSGSADEVAFPLLEGSDSGAVFENLKHDFPQRISYRRGADGSLTARVEGGKGKAQEFPMKKVVCP